MWMWLGWGSLFDMVQNGRRQRNDGYSHCQQQDANDYEGATLFSCQASHAGSPLAQYVILRDNTYTGSACLSASVNSG